MAKSGLWYPRSELSVVGASRVLLPRFIALVALAMLGISSVAGNHLSLNLLSLKQLSLNQAQGSDVAVAGEIDSEPSLTKPIVESAGQDAGGKEVGGNGTARATAPLISAAASRQANNVAIITIHGEIDGSRGGRSVMAESVRRRIRTAERAGADAIVFDINTPGGEVVAVLGICKAIRGSSIQNTIAWINTDAYSGGAIIAMACREIVTNDPASFGDAMPIAFGAGGASAIPDEILKKMLPPLVEEVLTSTRRHNEYANGYVRDEYLMLSVVANDVELWWVRDKVTGTRVAIDRSEYEMLFPGLPTGGSSRLAGAPGTALPPDARTVKTEQIPGQAPVTSPAGSQKLAGVMARAEQNQSLSTSRPQIKVADRDRWELLGKINDGSAASTFSASDLYYYGIAANPSTEVAGQAAAGNNPNSSSKPGRIVMVPLRSDADIQSFMGAKHLVRLNSNWSEGLVLFMTNIVVRGVLIAIFLMALFVELINPGAMLPGLVAVIALVALIAPSMLIGMANWWEVAAILAGIVLLGVEIFVLPGFGVSGGLGLLLLVGGLIATFIPAGQGLFPNSPQGQSNLTWAAVTILLAGGTAGVGIYFIAKHFGSIPIFNKLILQDPGSRVEDESFLSAMATLDDGPPVRIGDLGIAQTPLRPSGRIVVGEAIVDAVAAFGFIQMGSKIRVVEVSAFRIAVELAEVAEVKPSEEAGQRELTEREPTGGDTVNDVEQI